MTLMAPVQARRQSHTTQFFFIIFYQAMPHTQMITNGKTKTFIAFKMYTLNTIRFDKQQASRQIRL